MNSFAINLAPFDERELPTGVTLSVRSASEGAVELVVVRHKPGPKGGTTTEDSLGRVHDADLLRVLQAIHALGGQR